MCRHSFDSFRNRSSSRTPTACCAFRKCAEPVRTVKQKGKPRSGGVIAWGEPTEPQEYDTHATHLPVSLDGPGAAKCSLRRALLAPGYHLPLLRSYQPVTRTNRVQDEQGQCIFDEVRWGSLGVVG